MCQILQNLKPVSPANNVTTGLMAGKAVKQAALSGSTSFTPPGFAGGHQ